MITQAGFVSRKHQAGGGPRVRILAGGPYLVSGGVPLVRLSIGIDERGDASRWRPGGRCSVAGDYSLCRCGRTSTPPFCDGTHSSINFNGTETDSRKPYLDRVRRFRGATLELTDAYELCASARFCVRAGGIWTLIARSSRPEARRTAIREAALCPSGRLVVWDKEGQAIEPRFKLSLALVHDPQLGVSGPVWVRGGIPIESADGFQYETRNRVTLCRCGRSANKPFCDGSHTSAKPQATRDKPETDRPISQISTHS
jgi:CDGSH-type Zn-finger protein